MGHVMCDTPSLATDVMGKPSREAEQGSGAHS